MAGLGLIRTDQRPVRALGPRSFYEFPLGRRLVEGLPPYNPGLSNIGRFFLAAGA